MAGNVRIPKLAGARLERARQTGLWASGLPVSGEAALRAMIRPGIRGGSIPWK
jgi:hypothetical protein